ncbi:helix-turn-helix domain-containing protein [Bacillus pseudomycoides]|uniref:helix-turn-helix domain-containing protein n=1 Tax=Bacillus pseudomycoides TaxID=64104 RepID=UPI0037C06469
MYYHNKSSFTTTLVLLKIVNNITKIKTFISGVFMKVYTVKEMSSLLGKHEETIKRWIRSRKLPNSYRNSDKEG